jgi:hypothetical protein
MHILKADSMFKRKRNIFDRRGPRLIPNIPQYLNPTYFLLPTTFNVFYACTVENSIYVRNRELKVVGFYVNNKAD